MASARSVVFGLCMAAAMLADGSAFAQQGAPVTPPQIEPRDAKTLHDIVIHDVVGLEDLLAEAMNEPSAE